MHHITLALFFEGSTTPKSNKERKSTKIGANGKDIEEWSGLNRRTEAGHKTNDTLQSAHRRGHGGEPMPMNRERSGNCNNGSGHQTNGTIQPARTQSIRPGNRSEPAAMSREHSKNERMEAVNVQCLGGVSGCLRQTSEMTIDFIAL